MEVVELRPRSVGDILDLAIKICRARFGDLVKAVAVVVVPVSIVTAVTLLLVTPADDPFGRLADPSYAESVTSGEQVLQEIDGGAVALLFGGFLLAGVLSALAAQLATAATFKIVARTYLGLEQDWKDSVAFAGRRFWPMMWLQVVYGLLLGLAFMALIVPGFYFAVAWAVAIPVLLFENIRGRAALARSRELLSGRWWPALGLMVIVSVASGIFATVISALVSAVLPVTGDLAGAVAEGFAGGIGSVVTTPFAATAITVLFFDALVRKEGFDTAELADSMGVGLLLGYPMDPRRGQSSGPGL